MARSSMDLAAPTSWDWVASLGLGVRSCHRILPPESTVATRIHVPPQSMPTTSSDLELMPDAALPRTTGLQMNVLAR